MNLLEVCQPILQLIGHHESRNDYNAVWARIKISDRPNRPLVDMTVAEVLAWQDSIDSRYKSEAAGKYQILEDTLRDIYAPAGVSLKDKFDHITQDKLALHLLKRRGLKKFLAGEMSVEDFCNALAMEWASFPVVTPIKGWGKFVLTPGQSYYAGDNLNKATATVDMVLGATRRALSLATGTPPVGQPLPKPAVAKPSLLSALLALLRAVLSAFGRKK